eukprot:scaffold3219_cov105-Isochrysis_galbana.AAC.3
MVHPYCTAPRVEPVVRERPTLRRAPAPEGEGAVTIGTRIGVDFTRFRAPTVEVEDDLTAVDSAGGINPASTPEVGEAGESERGRHEHLFRRRNRHRGARHGDHASAPAAAAAPGRRADHLDAPEEASDGVHLLNHDALRRRRSALGVLEQFRARRVGLHILVQTLPEERARRDGVVEAHTLTRLAHEVFVRLTQRRVVGVGAVNKPPFDGRTITTARADEPRGDEIFAVVRELGHERLFAKRGGDVLDLGEEAPLGPGAETARLKRRRETGHTLVPNEPIVEVVGLQQERHPAPLRRLA